jgi:hypothetical protein
MEWLVEWWDGVELWLVQLPYPLLVTLVLVVLVPVCWILARMIDRGTDRIAGTLSGVRDADLPLGRADEDGGAASGRASGS